MTSNASNKLLALPLSIQTFESIICQNGLYVDKTAYLYQLVNEWELANKFFLSRPRRFGKSTTLTTLESIFLGKKELFEGLAISKTDYTWPVYPVIRLDMKWAAHPNLDRAEQSLLSALKDIAQSYALEIDEGLPEDFFKKLIIRLYKKTHQKVVVLIDEYDKPLIDLFNDIEEAKKIQGLLKRFYGVLKSADEYLRFVLITGVSKFTKVSVFSDLNHLTDLTMDTRYAALCGYTQEELEFYFDPWIEQLAQIENKTKAEILEKIKTWYNGYRLTKANIKVYNPWSTLHLFDKQSFENYWFETGTPTFLVEAMQREAFDLNKLEQPVSDTDFSTYDIEKLQIVPLLFQTGYLTIKNYDADLNAYQLDFPNYEVGQAFSAMLVTAYCELGEGEGSGLRFRLITALKHDKLEDFFTAINQLLAKIPYHLHQKNEGYYHSIFIAVCTMAGVSVEPEKATSMGRADAILQSSTSIYVIEFKINDTADAALKQIKDNRYAEGFGYLNKKIISVGVAFDKNQRKIIEWKKAYD